MDAQKKGPSNGRFWEVDALRGIAIVLMIFYHLVFDLTYFGVYSASMHSGPWAAFARGIASTFILVLGISLTLRYNRLKPHLGGWALFQKFLLRGVKIFALGMVVTAVTYYFLRYGYVIFGILHLLGLSTILAYPFLRSRWASLIAAIAIIGVGIFVSDLRSPSPWWLWLGVMQTNRYMVDFYPVLPWFGVALLGVFTGLTIYPGGIRRFAVPELSQRGAVRGLTFLGKHSLMIYLVHQPILFAILIAVGIGSI